MAKLDDLKQKTADELKRLRSLNVKNYTDETKKQSINELDAHYIESFNRRVRPFIYNPQSIKEIEDLEIIAEMADLKDDLYFSAVTMLSSHSVARHIPGRFVVWYIKKKNTGNFISLLGLSSDFNNLGSRDKEIGWTKETKFGELNRLQSVIQLKTAIPFQPFGFNALGGKLTAKLCHAKEIIDAWENKFSRDKAVLLTTTSLFGSYCQYTRLPEWKKLDSTSGTPFFAMPTELLDSWKEELKLPVSMGKEEVIKRIAFESAIPVKEFQHGYERGCFFCFLYDNYKDYLCGKIEADKLIPNRNKQTTISDVLSEWKELAVKRMRKLISEGTLKKTADFYDSLRTVPTDNQFFG